MIKYEDAEFHERDPKDLTWTETTVMIFSVPEAGIFGNAYVLARPNRGIVSSAISIVKGFRTQPYEMDLSDTQVHLQCPPSFANYELENGLKVQSDGPRNYRMQYKNVLGAAEFELDFKGLHDPFDPHDPSENPLLESEKAAGPDSRRGGEWENGHFEVKGHVTGRLNLRGEEYEVDCYEGMDHSWGPRPEIGTRSVSWVDINFGPELALHLAVPMNIKDGKVTYDSARFGFVVENGDVHGVVKTEITAERVDMMPISAVIRVEDVRGKKYEFRAAPVAGYPWYAFNPSHTCFQTLMRYESEGKVGYGEFGDIFGLDYLSERLSATGRHK